MSQPKIGQGEVSKLSSQKDKCIAIIRLRGTSEIQKPIIGTLKLLNLTRANHATLAIETPSISGMLQKVKDYITWGEPSEDTILLLLKERAELKGGERLTETNINEKLGYPSIKKLAEALYNLKIGFNKIPTLTPTFKLHPPKHGFKGSRGKSFSASGETGYRGKGIDILLKRMV